MKDNKDGSLGVRGIYCHNDGYPNGVGKLLQKCYTTVDAVNNLIDLGDLSSLGSTLSETVAYGRDKGETGVEARDFSSFDSFIEQASGSVQYVYCFSPTTNRWRIVAM